MQVHERVDIGRYSQVALAAVGAHGRIDVEPRASHDPRIELVDRLAGPHDRHRARQARCIDGSRRTDGSAGFDTSFSNVGGESDARDGIEEATLDEMFLNGTAGADHDTRQQPDDAMTRHVQPAADG